MNCVELSIQRKNSILSKYPFYNNKNGFENQISILE